MSEIVFEENGIHICRYAGPQQVTGRRMRYEIVNQETGQMVTFSAEQWDGLAMWFMRRHTLSIPLCSACRSETCTHHGYCRRWWCWCWCGC